MFHLWLTLKVVLCRSVLICTFIKKLYEKVFSNNDDFCVLR